MSFDPELDLDHLTFRWICLIFVLVYWCSGCSGHNFWKDGVDMNSLDLVVCPACGEPNHMANEEGAVDGPREYHAGCWVQKRTYTTTGPVTGECGHVHRTLAAAHKCRLQHSKNCRKYGGYSDRSIRAINCGEIVKLTAGEYAIWERLEFR